MRVPKTLPKTATLRALALLLGAAGTIPASGPAQPQAPPSDKAAPRAGTPPAPAPVVLPDPPLPVQQAQAIGLGGCTTVLDQMSRKVLTNRYDVQSGWSRSDPTRHVFQTIAALNAPANAPPDGFAALIAAPVAAGGCDGVAMQVFPLASDCQSAQKVLLQGGQTLGPMLNTRLMLDARGNRVILLPAFNNTCVAISVDTYFGSP